jgi:tetratricopeptide (TPR) repeat protein
LVNSSMAYARAGDKAKAQSMLNRALELDPGNAAANYNQGLLKAEMGDKPEAEKYLRAAIKADPKIHQAAFNLGILLHENNPKDSFKLISKAYEISPNPRYAFTLAYFMNQAGDQGRAEKMLALATREWPWYADSYLLLADIHLARKEKAKAKEVLQEGIKSGRLKPRHRQRLLRKLSVIK